MPMPALRKVCGLVLIALAVLGNAIAIRGIQAGVNTYTGERPFRQEFSTFKNSGAAFDLYILSLQKFQQSDQRYQLSYFEVAGIHGVPFRSWDGVNGKNYAGYCTHASTLFPTWHRPYMALFEEIIWYNAQQIASSYPRAKRDQYRAAARTLRIPYWDWSTSPTMPLEVNQPTIFINAPNGTSSIQNPLYTYTFHPQPSSSDFPPIGPLTHGTPINAFHSTVRYPDANGQSQPDLVNKQLQANAASLHVATYRLITQEPKYGPFSNLGYNDGRGNHYNNIENIHNAIHSFVGNGGHMGIIPYSGFDPIFWLHHANVDRLFALWQAVYPQANVTPQVNVAGTYTDDPGKSEDVNTRRYSPVPLTDHHLIIVALTPFHSDDSGNFWTSATVWSTQAFGYTYPEIVDWGVNSSQLTSNVKTRLNVLYNPTNAISQRSMSSDGSSALILIPNAMDVQWFANIRIDKSDTASPFFVHLFLGSPPVDPATWSFDPTLIGSHPVVDTSLLRSGDSELPMYGQIPLDHALLAAGDRDLAPEKIVPLLTSRLSWRLQDTNDSPLNISTVPSLKIHVVAQAVKPRVANDEFPEYGRLVVYREITQGKAGGIGEADDVD
ncbi:MAG: hypothetical protein Q9218_001417 [Villophora microphyllina]